jgi:hypothetical protein
MRLMQSPCCVSPPNIVKKCRRSPCCLRVAISFLFSIRSVSYQWKSSRLFLSRTLLLFTQRHIQRDTETQTQTDTHTHTHTHGMGLTAGHFTATFTDLLCIPLYYKPSTILHFKCSAGFYLQGCHDSRLLQ